MNDPRIATPEHECPDCENILSEGEICSCQNEDAEDDDDPFGERFLSTTERKQERAYWTARNQGWED